MRLYVARNNAAFLRLNRFFFFFFLVCKKPLAGLKYQAYREKPYCQPCHVKLHG